jgi:PAS domain S-box-containing protein
MLVILLGALALAGWVFDIETLKTVLPGLVSMKANTAICFLMAGASLILRATPEPVPATRLGAGRILAAIVVVIGLLTLVEYVFNIDLGFDQLPFRESAEEIGHGFPGRMSLASALDFTLLGTALLFLDAKGRRPDRWPSQDLTLAAAVISLLAFIGYFYGVETHPYAAIGLHTVIAFWLLCVGILCARPQRGLMAVFSSENLGGIVARRMLPAALLVPLLLGWLQVLGERSGVYGLGFGSALFATVIIVTFTALVAWASVELNSADRERERGADALRRSNSRLDGIISSAMDAVISVDAQRRIVLFNPAAEKMFGVSAGAALGQSIERFIPEWLREAGAEHPGNPGANGANSRQPGASGVVSGVRADGGEFPVEASVSQLDLGRDKLFTIILRDITERRQAETNLLESERREHARRMELEALMQSAPVFVWIAHDPECRRITGNHAAQEMLRVQPGANVSRHGPEEERPSHFKILKDGQALPDSELPMRVATRHGKAVLGREFEVRFEDGDSRWIYGNAVPLFNTDGTVRGAVSAFVDITTLKRAEQELSLSRGNLRSLAARLQAVREEERTRVAREIHDVLAQELTRLKIDIAQLTRQTVEPMDPTKQQNVRERLGGMMEVTDAAIGSVQRIATELRPVVLDSLGLCAAIEWQAKDFESRTGIGCSATIPESDPHLDRERSTALFRILQESLTNVARHAGATRVEIELRRGFRSVTLTVRDNGRGIRGGDLSDPASVGLLGMRERATLLGGRCQISGSPGGGTAVEASLPVGPEDHPADLSL